ncbi:hypothetical protein [Cellulomonas sp.]|uniref:hypothetical protein n=1 Tax=Cellulomonas sp. TaxID=40001 RepID=UPI002812289C|nr:hypothetical protein [Cellulomonas sp.]
MAIATIDELHERGVNITSSTKPDIDTSTPMGRASAWPLRARWMGPDAGSSGPSTPGPR